MTAALPVTPVEEVEAAFNQGLDVALLFGVNPVHDWPGGGFAPLLEKVRLSVGHGLHPDETVSACHLSLPSAHTLESWNDAHPRDGVETLCQPVIAPLFDSRQEAESLLRWTQALAPAGDPLRRCADWHDFVRKRWRERLAASAHGYYTQEMAEKKAWEDVLRVGGLYGDVENPFPAAAADTAGDSAAGSAETRAQGAAEQGTSPGEAGGGVQAAQGE